MDYSLLSGYNLGIFVSSICNIIRRLGSATAAEPAEIVFVITAWELHGHELKCYPVLFPKLDLTVAGKIFDNCSIPCPDIHIYLFLPIPGNKYSRNYYLLPDLY